jgi:serine phosphatase RsbU (regulator of sigma subunit)
MLELKDFIHLPQLDEWIAQIAAGGPGLTVVAGVDAHMSAVDQGVMIASGRATVFRLLLRQMLAGSGTGERPLRAAVVATGRDAVRLPRQLQRQVEHFPVTAAHSYQQQIRQAVQRHPDLLVLDRLNGETASLALLAVQDGRRVLAQCDTVYRGAGVLHHLRQLKVPTHLLTGLTWVVAVQRLAMLCPHCKQVASLDPDVATALAARLPSFSSEQSSYDAPGCERCQYSGNQGDVMAFDIFGTPPGASSGARPAAPSRLTVEEYVAGLVAEGYVAAADSLQLEARQFQRVYDLLSSSERRVVETNATLQRKVAELEAANRLLQQRTGALTSLYDIGLALTTSTSLAELARRICRYVHDLAGARRAILYLLLADGTAQILAQRGWSNSLLGRQVTVTQLEGTAATRSEPAPFMDAPPGVTVSQDKDRALLPTGLRLPLVSQERVAGYMIVHAGSPGSSKSAFAPGEVALLQTFASQAAVAIQRTSLIEVLREKISELEAAQLELVQKERLERELELARQVQQSLLPHTFPVYAGYTFAAHSEPAREVGGDFYDVFAIDDGRFGLVIGDVSDKGMAAALFMALTRSLLLAEARRELSPRQALTNVNRLLLQLSEPKMFVTVFYGIVDVAARRLCYARAGHDWPFLLRQGEVHRLQGNGVFLGFFDQDLFYLSEESIALQPGDRLVLYTDGLSDQMSPGGATVGLEQLAAILQDQARLPAEEICRVVFEAVARHQATAAQYDDMTLLLVALEDNVPSDNDPSDNVASLHKTA